jgi:hypothetical protein
VSQGLHGYFKERYTHYFFIADDLLLNPKINEDNYLTIFKLATYTSFIPEFITLHERKDYWARVGEAYRWNIKSNGVEASNMLPDYEDAIDKFSKFGLTIRPLGFTQIYGTPHLWLRFLCNRYFSERFRLFSRDLFFGKVLKKQLNLSYPLVGSYSDIFIISAKSIKEFCHYCGIFAATRLHVEVALPTSVILSSDEIITEKDLELQGKALWTNEDYQELEKYENSLSKLMIDFPSKYIYLHPIKLSKWKTEK